MKEIIYENLAGKAFIFGEQDCLSLFRQFYLQNFDIHIRNYSRPSDWSSDELDLMRLCYEREGFEMITKWKASELRPGDVLCMAIGEGNPNHFSIFVGDNKLVHHLYGRRSSVEPYHEFWQHKTCYLLRHPDVPDFRPTYPDVTIRSLLDARNSQIG